MVLIILSYLYYIAGISYHCQLYSKQKTRLRFRQSRFLFSLFIIESTPALCRYS